MPRDQFKNSKASPRGYTSFQRDKTEKYKRTEEFSLLKIYHLTTEEGSFKLGFHFQMTLWHL